MQNPVTEKTLSNGLKIILKEIHTAPLISQWIWYRVGSRDETPGITGISHWVEHMQFRGTPRFPQGVIDRAISRDGGFWNALTFLDWTTFFETMPSDKIELALQVEADRMTNSLFAPEDVELERHVIISERQGNENEPLFRLSEDVQATAFQVHAYHHEVIGDLVDLEKIDRDELYGHYQKYYHPGNAVLTIAGDFRTDELLDTINNYFGTIPAGGIPSRNHCSEPSQSEERNVVLEGPGDTMYLQIAFHAPEVTHPDFFSLVILDSLLSGASSLNMFGGGMSNKTSRLYGAVVEKDLAVSLQSVLHATKDPFLNTIVAIIHPASRIENVIEAIDAEIMQLLTTPPERAALDRAVKQARAIFAYGSERVTNQAFWLGLSEMVATLDWLNSFHENLQAVSSEDVQRVAQKYLCSQNRTVGVYIPTEINKESA